MLSFAFRRFLSAIPTLLVLLALSFALIRVAPGGPFDSEKTIPVEIQERLNETYHLDEPLWQQFLRYLGDLLQGDFGPSFQYKDYSVSELIAAGFPVSLQLGGLAMLLALGVGLSVGTVAALNQNGRLDHALMTAAMMGISIPNFVLAPLLVLVFAVTLRWLPAGGLDSWSSFVLPVVSLALPQIAYIARLTRGSMIEVLHSNYIRTARAKGLPEWLVIRRHALKPAILPVISYMGPATAALITGSVVIERIYSIPGLGSYFVQGALNRDYTLVMGVVIFYGIVIVVLNFIVDLLYAWLNPRIRYDEA